MAACEKQIDLQFRQHGGARKGAGGKPKGARAGVSHHGRQQLGPNTPVHVTMKMASRVWNLRAARPYTMIVAALRGGADKGGFRVLQFSAQRDHLHLIVEADSKI